MSDQTPPTPPAQPRRPPAAGPAGPAAGPGGPGQPPGGWPAQGYGPPPRRPGLWRQATSTTGGRVATGIAITLAALMLLGVLAVGVFAISRAAHLWGDRGERVSQRDGWGPGNRPDDEGGRMGPGMGPGNDLGDGGRMGGNGALGRLGGVQHGEFTVTGSDGKAVVMTLQRGVVTAASATSASVRSDDGFSQTYVVNSGTRVAGGSAAPLRKDDRVVVVARKADRVAVQVRAVSR